VVIKLINVLPNQEMPAGSLDYDWLELIKEAKNQGYTPEEIRSLLTILSK